MPNCAVCGKAFSTNGNVHTAREHPNHTERELAPIRDAVDRVALPLALLVGVQVAMGQR
jgi:hypothetical protein